MKAALLFLMVACVASVCSTGHATSTDDASLQQKAKPLVPQSRHNANADKRSPKSVVPIPKPTNRGRATKSSKGSDAGKATNSRPQVLEPRNSSTNAGLGASRNAVNARLVPPSAVSRPAALAPNNIRHRGINPATVGGPRSKTVASAAVLVGRAVGRRP
jgi:hypothetical protein